MAFNYLAGLASNFVTLSTSTLTASGSEDANFPAANAGVGLPAQPFKFAAAALDDKLTVDFGSANNPDTLRGEGYDRIFKDEDAFIKDDAMLAIRPLMFDTGAPIWNTTTPWGTA